MVSVADMARHVADICARDEIYLEFRYSRPWKSWCLSDSKHVCTAPIRSVISYATALHEIGHIKGPYQQSRYEIAWEIGAWEWARSNALIRTPRMEAMARARMEWHEQEVREGRGVVLSADEC
jgi:hypothetical protein